MIAVVKSEADIRAAILFARKYNLHVTIKSSGHSFVGRSTYDDSLQINLSAMKEISVHPDKTDRNSDGEVKVQTGLKWGDIYEEVGTFITFTLGCRATC